MNLVLSAFAIPYTQKTISNNNPRKPTEPRTPCDPTSGLDSGPRLRPAASSLSRPGRSTSEGATAQGGPARGVAPRLLPDRRRPERPSTPAYSSSPNGVWNRARKLSISAQTRTRVRRLRPVPHRTAGKSPTGGVCEAGAVTASDLALSASAIAAGAQL